LKIKELSNNFTRAYQDYKAKADQLEAQISRAEKRVEELKKKRRALPMPDWIDIIIRPIADELAKELPDFDLRILGPMGICSAVPVHFYRKGVPKEEMWDEGNVRSITFVPRDLQNGEIMIRNISVDTGEFRPGTIGELNGMNHPSVKIPEDADISWFMAWVR
jgi:hypothetical protein